MLAAQRSIRCCKAFSIVDVEQARKRDAQRQARDLLIQNYENPEDAGECWQANSKASSYRGHKNTTGGYRTLCGCDDVSLTRLRKSFRRRDGWRFAELMGPETTALVEWKKQLERFPSAPMLSLEVRAEGQYPSNGPLG